MGTRNGPGEKCSGGTGCSSVSVLGLRLLSYWWQSARRSSLLLGIQKPNYLRVFYSNKTKSQGICLVCTTMHIHVCWFMFVGHGYHSSTWYIDWRNLTLIHCNNNILSTALCSLWHMLVLLGKWYYWISVLDDYQRGINWNITTSTAWAPHYPSTATYQVRETETVSDPQDTETGISFLLRNSELDRARGNEKD